MLFEGVKLLFVGMATVLLFLSFTIALIQLVSRLARGAVAREVEAIRLERQHRNLARQQSAALPGAGAADVEDDIVVIAAAVGAYEAELLAGA
ncbi:OadG family protein [Desulfogranum mediterraneum]|uniref:OadG family protein n=1 Tax=Desulfogranum mediterraneum TaxID=160661 RepID=UPI0004279154|nr:OadG family protein [Desulfogranum mediterraneum]